MVRDRQGRDQGEALIIGLKTVQTPTLEIAFLEEDQANGWPVVLAHGFPYDVHAYDAVAPRPAEAAARVIVPYLRGFGPTRFLSKDTMRSGQQAALGHDLIDLLDSLGIERAILAGYDWGGCVSCVASAIWPERVAGLVSYAGSQSTTRCSWRAVNILAWPAVPPGFSGSCVPSSVIAGTPISGFLAKRSSSDDLPWEAPDDFANAILTVRGWTAKL